MSFFNETLKLLEEDPEIVDQIQQFAFTVFDSRATASASAVSVIVAQQGSLRGRLGRRQYYGGSSR